MKLKAQDGKYRLTDVVDIEGMFRIIESIPGKNTEPIKQWLASLGRERIDEKWIAKRLKGIQDRKELTDIWQENGITDGKEYAILTNEIYKKWVGMQLK